MGRVPLSSLRDKQPPPGAAQSLGASAPTPSSRKACAAGTDAGCGGVAVGKGIEISTWRGWNGGGVIGEISGCAEGLGSGKEKNTNLAAGPERRKGAHSHVLNENLALRYVVVGLPRFPRVVPTLHVAHGLRTIRAVAPHRGPPRVPRANFENSLSRGFRPRSVFPSGNTLSGAALTAHSVLLIEPRLSRMTKDGFRSCETRAQTLPARVARCLPWRSRR